MVSHFDELVNQVRYQLSVRFLTTSTIHAQQGNFKTDLMKTYLPKDSKQSIQVVVDEIWNTYDVDNDGIMTEAEVSHFIHEYMPLFQPGFVYSQKVFEKIFREIDEDGNNVVTRDELTQFILKLLNQKVQNEVIETE